MKKKLLNPPEDSIVMEGPSNRIVKRRNALLAIPVVLLILVSLSFLGETFAYLGSLAMATIPGMVVAYVVHRAFHNFLAAAVSGMFVELLLIHLGVVASMISNGNAFLLAISSLSGYLAAILLAVIIGMSIVLNSKELK